MNNGQESLGSRLSKFALFCGAIFAVTLGVVISQRLSEDALALLVGLGCGVLAMTPMLGMGLLLWRREDKRHAQPFPQMQSPPVIVVTPQALPGYGAQMNPALPAPEQLQGAWPWNSGATERRFTIVGGEE